MSVHHTKCNCDVNSYFHHLIKTQLFDESFHYYLYNVILRQNNILRIRLPQEKDSTKKGWPITRNIPDTVMQQE